VTVQGAKTRPLDLERCGESFDRGRVSGKMHQLVGQILKTARREKGGQR
jgi:hypothetical protein